MLRTASAGGDDAAQYIPARMLNEFTYCPRLFYLEFVEGLFAHNRYTLEGAARHKRVDEKEDALPSVKDAIEQCKIHVRSVTLSSEHYGVIAKLDLIEANGDLATPVDYKRGSPKQMEDGSLGAWDPERVQMCVQALVLRENGYRCDEGVLFFWETRQRVRIAIDDELLALTDRIIADARDTIESQRMPPPLDDSPKCPKCSLVGICLPDETTHCAQQVRSDGEPVVQKMLFDVGPQSADDFENEAVDRQTRPIRQLVTTRDERRSLYLNTPGLYVGKTG
ncbi:MAG: CRISPR-associated protein Cas4, partial [Planctomycetales bacterium]|nr:CRISPR-associated protein Cas4 [Planctomycetales bacterium]